MGQTYLADNHIIFRIFFLIQSAIEITKDQFGYTLSQKIFLALLMLRFLLLFCSYCDNLAKLNLFHLLNSLLQTLLMFLLIQIGN